MQKNIHTHTHSLLENWEKNNKMNLMRYMKILKTTCDSQCHEAYDLKTSIANVLMQNAQIL